MSTLKEDFIEYRRACFPDVSSIGRVQRLETIRAFYAGALSALASAMYAAVAGGESGEEEANVRALFDEAEEVCGALRAEQPSLDPYWVEASPEGGA